MVMDKAAAANHAAYEKVIEKNQFVITNIFNDREILN